MSGILTTRFGRVKEIANSERIAALPDMREQQVSVIMHIEIAARS